MRREWREEIERGDVGGGKMIRDGENEKKRRTGDGQRPVRQCDKSAK